MRVGAEVSEFSVMSKEGAMQGIFTGYWSITPEGMIHDGRQEVATDEEVIYRAEIIVAAVNFFVGVANRTGMDPLSAAMGFINVAIESGEIDGLPDVLAQLGTLERIKKLASIWGIEDRWEEPVTQGN